MFGRRKRHESTESLDAAVRRASKEKQDPRAQGPYDSGEIESHDDYLDLGSILIKPQSGVGLRLEVDEKTKRPRAINLDIAGSTAQIQAFAAPKSSGLWDEIRKDLKDSLARNQGAPQSVEGTFGTELRARFPAKASDGTKGYRPARFVGIDGPRWFLRVVISGAAAVDPEASEAFDEIIRGVVVVRGNEPLPPRDLLPLQVPESTRKAPVSRKGRRSALRAPDQPARTSTNSGRTPIEGGRVAARARRLQPPERGPEVTEVR